MMTDCVDLMEERKCWRRREDEKALFVFRGMSVMMMTKKEEVWEGSDSKDDAGCNENRLTLMISNLEPTIKGLPAYSHHDRFPPWWVFVRDDNGGNLSGDKIPPLMMIIINHLTQFNSSRSLVMLLPDCINTALNNQRQKTISHLLKFWYCTHYNNWYERKWQ